VSTGPDEIVTVARRRDSGGEADSFYISEWNTIASPGWTYTPHLGHYKFPLKVGASYVAAYEALTQ
jgi:hypothetical protein